MRLRIFSKPLFAPKAAGRELRVATFVSDSSTNITILVRVEPPRARGGLVDFLPWPVVAGMRIVAATA